MSVINALYTILEIHKVSSNVGIVCQGLDICLKNQTVS